jgi:hypothetical protein
MKRIELFIALIAFSYSRSLVSTHSRANARRKAPKLVQQKEQDKKGMEERHRKIGK